jgi:hypothetical protein
MRWGWVIVWLLMGQGTVIGQRTDARTSALRDATLPVYQLTRIGNQVYYIVSYEKGESVYDVTETNGRVSRHYISSVKKIERLTPEEIQKYSDDLDKPEAVAVTPSVRTEPRVGARTQARTSFSESSASGGLGPSFSAGPAVSTETAKAGLSKASGTGPGSARDPQASLVPRFVDQSQDNAGFSETGMPLHVGARGGIYHYSKNGNKVYHSRKK